MNFVEKLLHIVKTVLIIYSILIRVLFFQGFKISVVDFSFFLIQCSSEMKDKQHRF
jgi:hypothetical protein